MVSFLRFVLQEAARVFLEAVEEEVDLPANTKLAWQNVLTHLSAVAAAAVDTSVTRVAESVFTADERALIRDTWAVARTNSIIAPQTFIM